ncbi:hypothetical protein BH24PSE2_BH24PSE2_04760 [soil metagenome]
MAGSGKVDIDLPVVSEVRRGKRHFEGEVGDGRGEALIDTGSGSISVGMR